MSSKAYTDSGVQARALLLPFLPSSQPTCNSLVKGAAFSVYTWTYAH